MADKAERRSPAGSGAQSDAHGDGITVSIGATVHELDEYRQRRGDRAAWHAALDWLDSAGLCCCWVLPRPCPRSRERAR